MHTCFHTPQPILVHHPPYYQSIHSTPCNLLLCTHPHPLVPHPLLHSTPPPFYHPTPSGTTLEAAMRAIVIDLSTITACPSPLDELRYFLRIAYERRGPSPPLHLSAIIPRSLSATITFLFPDRFIANKSFFLSS